MPKKVQPYGSGEDAELAALGRSGPPSATGVVNDLAATLTIREVAARAVEAVRALTYLTADAGELTDPDEVRAFRSQLLHQAGRQPRAEHHAVATDVGARVHRRRLGCPARRAGAGESLRPGHGRPSLAADADPAQADELRRGVGRDAVFALEQTAPRPLSVGA